MNTSQWSELPLVLTSDQAAAVLQINRRTLTNMLVRGILRGVKIGKEWRVSRAEMIRFVEGTSTETPPAAAPVHSEATATLVNKGGLLVVRTEPLTDLADIVRQERERRVAELIQRAGL
ncbi:MAG: helix-turn-helix domain-containing protein [Anaerolineae bacterium]